MELKLLGDTTKLGVLSFELNLYGIEIANRKLDYNSHRLFELNLYGIEILEAILSSDTAIGLN